MTDQIRYVPLTEFDAFGKTRTCPRLTGSIQHDIDKALADGFTGCFAYETYLLFQKLDRVPLIEPTEIKAHWSQVGTRRQDEANLSQRQPTQSESVGGVERGPLPY